MTSTNSHEELTEYLRSRLIECGWRDQVAGMCRGYINQHGVEQVRLEQIISEVRIKARQIVPEQVKQELVEMIRKLDQESQRNNTTSQPQQQSMPLT